MRYSFGCTDLNLDCQLFIGSQRVVIGQRQEADLIQSVRGVGDQLPEEDLRHKEKTPEVSVFFKMPDEAKSFSFTSGSFIEFRFIK